MSTLKSRATSVARVVLALLRAGLIGASVWVALIDSDDALCAIVNLSLVLLPFALLLALTGRWVWSLSGAAAFALFLYGMGELKFVYFYTRLIVADWAFVSEPANWTIVRQYPRIYTVLSLFVVGAGLLAIDAIWASRRHRAAPSTARWLALLVFVALSGTLYGARKHHTWEVFTDDADCGTAHRCGVAARLLYSVQMFEFDPPSHAGDPTPFLQREAALPPLAEPPLARLPDILLWLHESTFDPRQFKLPGARLPKLAMFDPAANTKALGPLRVHTFGGKTWLSEFSVLTGLVPDDFGAQRTLVFNSVGPDTRSNLFRLLKANGYRSVVLMPTFKRFYGAGITYEGMGADQILTLRDFPEYDQYKGDEWDIAETPRMAEAALKIVRAHRAGPNAAQPLFLYFLSVKEHAPYDKHTRIGFRLDKTGIAKQLAGRLTDYVQRLQTLDAAVATIDKALLAKNAAPTLFAWFGDHQAYYEHESPPYRFTFTEPKHVTQFQVRANYAVDRQPNVPLTDIALLPGLITDLAGVDRDQYFQTQSAMRRLCHGALADCEDKALLDSYKARLFGREVGLFPSNE